MIKSVATEKVGNSATKQPSNQETQMSDITTRGIRIEVESMYVEERSDPKESYYFFAYHVVISNNGAEAAQLVSREWVITDSDGNVERVQGAGVVGETPLLQPGGSFEYTSFCPLRTSMGSMQGGYMMRLTGGETFRAEIAPFTLAVPGVVN
jgi:ApaG protein